MGLIKSNVAVALYEMSKRRSGQPEELSGYLSVKEFSWSCSDGNLEQFEVSSSGVK